MIDQAALAAVLGDKATAEDQERLKRELEQAVRASVGFSSKRGDDVVVSFLTFAPAVLSEEEAVPASTVVERFLPQALAIVAVVLAFLLVVRPLVAAARPGAARASAGDAIDPDAVPANSPIVAGGEDENDIQVRIRRHVERFQSLQPQHVSDLVRRESENSAEVLRRWIRTQQGGAM
jgi:flagellar biosynthesis/type III secretory pathway M-ring protein FliF/YscJ